MTKERKKKVLIFGLLLLILVLMVTIIFVFRDKKIDKYSMDITITTAIDGKKYRTLIELYSDGVNARVNHSDFNCDSYIMGGYLYYLKDDTYFMYKTNTSYIDLYKTIKNIKNLDKYREEKDFIEYTKLLSVKEINEILDSLFFSLKAMDKTKADITYTGKELTNFNITLGDIDGYDEIDIDIKIKQLEDDFKVNVSRINRGSASASSYRFKTTDENIYEMIK